ncbi:MAG: Gfo/Idh/MocA family oxidoreductase [Pirellulales bacterium]|nr:Gfo/Idh/MocA family oxidoreductase [Pirellulales bacterium]
MPLKLNYLPTLPRDRSPGIGCIGAGFIMADCHLVAYSAAGFNPVAISSHSGKSAQAAAKRHKIPHATSDYLAVLDDPAVSIVDVAVPPDNQFDVIKQIVKRKGKIRGILAQKPLGVNYPQAKKIVDLCQRAGITLVVNQNMRYDQSIRACHSLLAQGALGEPVLATIDMRAIPHWMPWQERQGWVTLRIMSIHHLDTFRFWFGTPTRIFASIRPDPRTAKRFVHMDGICLYILEYERGSQHPGLRCSSWDDVWAGPAREGAGADLGIRWRVEGTTGLAQGTIGWPEYPKPTPSTLDYTTTAGKRWHRPRWNKVWFPDAFAGPMAELLCAVEGSAPATMTGEDNLQTMALVDAAYLSAKQHRAVEVGEIITN